MFEKERFFDLMRNIPKAEIHLHLEDFIAGESAKSENISSLSEFISIYHSLLDSLRTVEDLDSAFANMVIYMKQNGIVYAEVFASISRYVRGRGMKYPELVRYFERKCKQIKQNHNIIIKFLPDVTRTYGPDVAEGILEMIIGTPSNDIIGIGLGGSEENWPNRHFFHIFERARAAGLRTVAHAGESVDYQSIVEAIAMGAERIGHATSGVRDEATINMLVSKQIPLEISPTSNLITGKFVKEISMHPVREYLERGAFVTINTDDPTLFNTSLINEYWNLYSKLGYRLKEIYRILCNGFLASFMPEEEKRYHIKNLNRSWNRSFIIAKRKQVAGAVWDQTISTFAGGE
ncbi:MAG: hypothetical protein FWE38_05200 [Firmicutes bacterium]|nr:hypothetical protein [Bacillota bacterium]